MAERSDRSFFFADEDPRDLRFSRPDILHDAEGAFVSVTVRLRCPSLSYLCAIWRRTQELCCRVPLHFTNFSSFYNVSYSRICQFLLFRRVRDSWDSIQLRCGYARAIPTRTTIPPAPPQCAHARLDRARPNSNASLNSVQMTTLAERAARRARIISRRDEFIVSLT